MEEDEMITLFESMTPEEQASLSDEELDYIINAQSKALAGHPATEKDANMAQDWNDAKGGSTKPFVKPEENLYRKYGVVQPYRPDVNTTSGNLADVATKLSMLPAEGMGMVPGVKALYNMYKGEDPIEHRSGADMMTDFTNTATLGLSKAADVYSSPEDQRSEIANQYDEAMMREPQAMFLAPNPSGLVASTALNSGLGAINDTENPARGAMIGAGASVGVPVIAKGLSKMVPSQALTKAGTMQQNPGVLNKSGDALLERFLGLPSEVMAKLRSSGELEQFYKVLDEQGILAPFRGRRETLNQAVSAMDQNLGPNVGNVVKDLPNAYNNDLSQAFDNASMSQDMTGIEDDLVKPKLQKEADRWANRKGMTTDPVEAYQSNEWQPSGPNEGNVQFAGSADDLALQDVHGQFANNPVEGSGIMVNPTAGNPIEGVNPSRTWVNKQPIAGTGMVVPQVTAPQIHNEIKSIDDRLFQSNKPGAGAIMGQNAPGLEAKRQIYDQELRRQARLAGREKDLESARFEYGAVSQVRQGLERESDRLKSFEASSGLLGAPGVAARTAIGHIESTVGLSAKELARRMDSWVKGAGMSKTTPKIARMIDLVLTSNTPEVEHEIFSQQDEEYNRAAKEAMGAEE